MATTTVNVAVTNAALVELLPASTTRRGYIISNQGAISVDVFFNTQTVPFINLAQGGFINANVSQGDKMEQIKAQLNGGAGPQNIEVTEF